MGIEGKNWPKLVKITHGKGRCVINVPARWARELDLDKSEYALLHKVGDRILEVLPFRGGEDYKQYVQED